MRPVAGVLSERWASRPAHGEESEVRDVRISTLAGPRGVPINCCNRRGLCPVQCRRVIASTNFGSNLEQRLVPLVCFRRYQLYEELGVRRFCSVGVLDRSVHFHDSAAAANSGRAGTFAVGQFAGSQAREVSSSLDPGKGYIHLVELEGIFLTGFVARH